MTAPLCEHCKLRPCMEQVDDSWGPDFCTRCGPCIVSDLVHQLSVAQGSTRTYTGRVRHAEDLGLDTRLEIVVDRGPDLRVGALVRVVVPEPPSVKTAPPHTPACAAGEAWAWAGCPVCGDDDW